MKCEGVMGICRTFAVVQVCKPRSTPFLLDIYQGNTNTHGKIGGQKVVTSASVYVRMGRLTSVFLGFYWSNSNTQNLIPIAMCQFKDIFLTNN